MTNKWFGEVSLPKMSLFFFILWQYSLRKNRLENLSSKSPANMPVQLTIKAVSARIRISAAPSVLAIYFLLCLLNFDSAFGCRQLFQTQNVLSAQTMRKVRLKKELLSRGHNQHGAIMAQSRSLLLFIKWQHTLSIPRLPSLPLCLIL